MKSFFWITVALLLILFPLSVFAGEEEETEQKGIPPLPDIEIPEISEQELWAIIDRADAFFHEQGIENMAVDLDVFRDPSNVLTLEDLKSGEVDIKAPFSPIIAHYFYKMPGWYQLKIMGFIAACSDPGVATYTNMLPLPGGQLNIPQVTDNYDLIYLGYGEVNSRKTHRVRFAAKDFKEQFLKYTIYEFDVEEGYLSRLQTRFDDGFWHGHASGEFCYMKRGGKLLPAYAYGEVFIMPFFRMALWGRWYNWEFNTGDFGVTLNRGKEEEFVPIELDGD